MTGAYLEVVFNQFEALLWLTISLGLLIHSIIQRVRRIPISLSRLFLIPGFAVFGLSDLIEAQTGAWWTPWWLLVMKGLCVVIFLLCFREYLKTRRKS